MKIGNALIEAKTCQESDKAEVMIPMQMRNKNLIDFAAPDFKHIHLHLRAFAAINQKSVVQSLQYLRCWMPVMGWHSRITA